MVYMLSCTEYTEGMRLTWGMPFTFPSPILPTFFVVSDIYHVSLKGYSYVGFWPDVIFKIFVFECFFKFGFGALGKTCQSPGPGVMCQSKIWFVPVRYFFWGFVDNDISQSAQFGWVSEKGIRALNGASHKYIQVTGSTQLSYIICSWKHVRK
jgi:hypothetical protein